PGALVIGERRNASDGFNAAHACGCGLLRGDLEHADVAGAADVRAPAQLLAVEASGRGRVGDGHDADVLLVVAVAEEGESAGGEGLVERGDVRLNFGVEQYFVVYLLLDVAQLGGINRGEGRKIEAQPH